MAELTFAPYGSWRSPVRIDDLVGDVIDLAEPWIDGVDLYWLEARPTEGGRRGLVRVGADGIPTDLIPAPISVRSRVHEYGGGAYVAAGGTVVYSDQADGRLFRLDPGATGPVPITPTGPWRYADLRFDAMRRRFVAVREDHSPTGEPVAAIVDVPLDGERDPRVLVTGPDFLAAPRISPDGGRLAWLEWDHPHMPWDATRLRVASIAPDGLLGASDLAAGGPDESIAQPEWSADGVLHLVSDRTGWWNLYRLVEGPRLEPLAPLEAEFADPAWTFGRSSYGFLGDGSIVAIARQDGHDHLFHILPGVSIGEVETSFTEFEGLQVRPSGILVRAGSPDGPSVIVRLDPQTLAPTGVLRRASSLTLDPASLSAPETIHFPSSGDRLAHGLFYPPRNAQVQAPDTERPPLVVVSHGGPTSNASTAFNLGIQVLTSRGIGVVDVDYGGSTGYGRDYRRQLEGAFGVVDVDDCIAAARFLVDRGDVDGGRLAIAGGSSGGFTVLAALAFHDTFAAGISRCGIGDLERLAGDTHKFESRYLDSMIGPYPEMADVYRARSPIHALDRISCPVLIQQGADDKVVPPSQAEAIVAALSASSIPYAYLLFAGEGHGFRGDPAIRRSLEADLSFLGQVFGFTPADDLTPLEVVGIESWRASHQVRHPA